MSASLSTRLLILPTLRCCASFLIKSLLFLCRFLKAAGEDVPPLTKEIAKVEFNDQRDYWWSHYTTCHSFSRQVPVPNSSQRRHTFHYEVTKDGVSAGVLMLHPAPSPSAEAPSPSAEAPPPNSKKRKRQQKALPPPNGEKQKQKQQQQTNTGWVRDLPDRDIGQPPALSGWTLGGSHSSLLLSTASQQQTACRSSTPLTAPLTAKTQPCHGVAAGGGRPVGSSTGCSRLSCGTVVQDPSSKLPSRIPPQPR